ncbi:nuclear transport factor 2 family protein [Mycolicibacterium houstonense]|uniref:nuclear transport factor 2 family protein n=1 Tax=Mycolicibacterium houstonense TaxID=146021 RepID=UPI003F9D1C7C
MSSATSDPQLQEMLDEFALRKLVHGYCRAVDRGDIATLRSLYHQDAEDDHGSFSSGSVDEFVRTLVDARPYLRSMQHHITTTNFAISGDRAEGEIYSIATHTFVVGDGETELIIGGRYLDKYEKRDRKWGFTARQIVTDWAHVHDPSIVDTSHPMTRATPLGSPGPDDPSYAFFSLLGHNTAR